MREIEEKLKLLDIQIIGSVSFIASIIISIILTYNQRLYTLKQKTIFNRKQTYIISNFNRILVLIIVTSFLYNSYEQKKLAEEKNSNVTLNNLDIVASSLSVVSAIIVLYITAKAPVEDALDIENPNF
ncbi:MAG: hypothetical protein E7169_05290 [Firmicutes bacterium]|nr:hypothetical protein [Bacillota bacterium]